MLQGNWVLRKTRYCYRKIGYYNEIKILRYQDLKADKSASKEGTVRYYVVLVLHCIWGINNPENTNILGIHSVHPAEVKKNSKDTVSDSYFKLILQAIFSLGLHTKLNTFFFWEVQEFNGNHRREAWDWEMEIYSSKK